MTAGFPAAAREALADTQLRRNLGHATRTIRDKRAGVVGEVGDWEQLREAGQAIKDEALARLPELLEQLEASVQAAGGHVHWARDGAEANAAVAAVAKRARGGRGGEGQVDHHRRDQAQRRAGRRGHRRGGDRPGRADRAARPRLALAHPRPGHPPQPGRDPRPVPPRAGRHRPVRRAGRADRRRPRAPAAQVPRGAHGRERRELRRGRDRHRVRGRVRGQRADVHHAARRAGDRDGHREGAAALARPGGVPPAAAALLDRRADEPLHLAVERRPRGRRPAGVPPGAARQRAHRRAGRRRRPPVASLHPLLGLSERLPGLLARRRARLRVGLPRPDRGDPRSPARPARGARRRCRSPPACAARAPTCAR